MNRPIRNEKGSALLITTILLLGLIVLIGTCLNLSGMQYDLAALERFSSSTYTLAESSIEEYVDLIQGSLITQLPILIRDIRNEQINEALKSEDYEGLTYDVAAEKICLEGMKELLDDKIYSYLQESFADKPIDYQVQSDPIEGGYFTEISIKTVTKDINNSSLKPKNQFRVIATAITKRASVAPDIFDKQVVEALIEVKVPQPLTYEIFEKYRFYDEIPVEVLNQTLLCFSDVVVSQNGELDIEGDVRVKGTLSINEFEEEEYLEDKNERNGGIIAAGGKIAIKDNVYCLENILAIPSFSEVTQIEIGGNSISSSLGIINIKETGKDDSVSDGEKTKVVIDHNAMVEHQVIINKEAVGGKIQVKQTLFNLCRKFEESNPFSDGGIFSIAEDSSISASEMYIENQPNLKLEEVGVGTDKEKIYKITNILERCQTDIDKEKEIAIRDGMENLEAIMIGNRIKTEWKECYGLATFEKSLEEIEDKDKQPVGKVKISACSKAKVNKSNEVNDVIENLPRYYEGKEEGFRRKIIEGSIPESYKELSGYMTVMRSVFYKAINESQMQYTSFEDLIDTSVLPGTKEVSNQESWKCETPICITNGGEIDISKFASLDRKEVIPTILISHNEEKGKATKPLKLTASGNDGLARTFKGVIISKGPVEIEQDLRIEGVVIIGGPEAKLKVDTLVQNNIYRGEYAGLKVADGKVEMCFDPGVLLEIESQDLKTYRMVLDALKFTNYNAKTTLSEMMNRQEPYTYKVLDYAEKALLTVDIQGLGLEINSLKKIDEG